MLAAADDMIGNLVATLDRTGQRQNTLIFLLGDNGATTERRAGLKREIATAGNNGPYRGFKFSTFDGGMHVPAVVNWPGHIPSGKFINEVVMTADILPTVCHLTGTPLPTDRTIDGRNIWPVNAYPAGAFHRLLTNTWHGQTDPSWRFARANGS